MTLKTTKNTGGSVLTIFGRSDFLGIFLKEMDFISNCPVPTLPQKFDGDVRNCWPTRVGCKKCFPYQKHFWL